ncbi:MAG: hypothetical protein RLZZ385_1609 [Pseudomonadota bacterium]
MTTRIVPTESRWQRHIPNAITSSRILLAAAFPLSPPDWHLPIILLALLTEFLDGFLARLCHWISYLGQVLDPLADKLFALSVCLTWVWLGQLTVWQWLLLTTRDFGILFITLALWISGRIGNRKSIEARLPSKVTTGFQYLVFLAVLTDSTRWLLPLIGMTALLGAGATLHYIMLLRRPPE